MIPTLGPDPIVFNIPGPCVAQGSMAAVTNAKGKTVVLHSKRRRKDGSMPMTVAKWRRIAQQYADVAMRGIVVIDGAVSVRALFVLPPRKKANRWAKDTPDLDKLQRALGDALEGVVVTNDKRIVEWHSRKQYAEESRPEGVYVVVQALEEVES